MSDRLRISASADAYGPHGGVRYHGFGTAGRFRAFQTFEAGVGQVGLRDGPEEVRSLSVAVARYLAAPFPTRRERKQTFTIASRLHRGETIHES